MRPDRRRRSKSTGGSIGPTRRTWSPPGPRSSSPVTPFSATATRKPQPAPFAPPQHVDPGPPHAPARPLRGDGPHGRRLLRELFRLVRGGADRLAARNRLELSGDGN